MEVKNSCNKLSCPLTCQPSLLQADNSLHVSHDSGVCAPKTLQSFILSAPSQCLFW